MKILLTGASGQLGRCLLDRLPPGWAVDAPAHAALDITDLRATLAYVIAYRPVLIINAAAYNAVDRAESERAHAFAVNAQGPAHLAQAAARVGAQLLHLSTDYVFDGQGRTPAPEEQAETVIAVSGTRGRLALRAYAEDETPRPLNIYGLSKRAGEEAVLAALPHALVLRTSWLFSEYGNNFVRTMLRLSTPPAAGGHASIRVVDDQIGSPTYAGDLADVIIALLVMATGPDAARVSGGIYHYGGAQAMTWHAFARSVLNTRAAFDDGWQAPALLAISTADYAAPAPRPRVSALSCARIEALGILRRPPADSLPAVLRKLIS